MEAFLVSLRSLSLAPSWTLLLRVRLYLAFVRLRCPAQRLLLCSPPDWFSFACSTPARCHSRIRCGVIKTRIGQPSFLVVFLYIVNRSTHLWTPFRSQSTVLHSLVFFFLFNSMQYRQYYDTRLSK